jgi:hypothetical protein
VRPNNNSNRIPRLVVRVCNRSRGRRQSKSIRGADPTEVTAKMAQEQGDVLLVGSVPLESAREVFTTCMAALGRHLDTLPDGEVGPRKTWIQCQALLVFNDHPDIETMARPNTPDGLAREYSNNWVFRLKQGVETLDFPDLHYARWAIESYATFCELRDRGKIPAGVRFQISLPTPFGGCGTFFHEPRDRELVLRPYESAMMREIAEICRCIPPNDLAIQWDVCIEVLEVVTGAFVLPGDPFARAAAQFDRISRGIPIGVRLGYHFCYGDLAHRHLVEPDTLALSVRMANLAVSSSGRRVDWVHLPVPIARNDDVYFAPLRDLRNVDAKVFLGLVHLQDGVAGTISRAQTARRHLAHFGIATECGLGRRQPETLDEVLWIHREAADRLAKKSA